MESVDYEKILNAMPETGIYVIREDDHGLLYFNKRVREISPQARLGMPCDTVCAGSCGCCPLQTIEDRQESRSVGYHDAYGGVVDITATRTLWEGTTPAFILTVAPRVNHGGYSYRKILRVDLVQDSCDVLKSDPDGWQPREGPFFAQLKQFAASGAIHPEDAERLIAFIQPQQLCSAIQAGSKMQSLIYRRLSDGGYRWNLMEIFPDLAGDAQYAILCVKDVHNVLREGQKWEGPSLRSQELIRSLGEQNSNIYTIDLNTGEADIICLNGHMQSDENCSPQPWPSLMDSQITQRLHEAYQAEFLRRFSLEGLRQAQKEGRQKIEFLCQWHWEDAYRYISVTAHLSQEHTSYTVLAIQDVEQRMRQELAHVQRDMQMAAILKSRFKMMNTVFLDSGQCERVDLSKPAGEENTLRGDYALYIENALSHYVHPDDAKNFWSVLSLEHLRETARSMNDYAEEVCLYRQRSEPVRWIELRVIYTRQKDQVMVHILGQDVTREKQQEETRRQVLEDRAYIISSLSALFFSTYYLDLEHDTFRAVTQLRRVEDVLGEEVSCTAALKIYANHFIHPDDRADYLNAMNSKNLLQTLRWWQPYVAVEYRKLPDDPAADSYEWVRATAILARSGADDLPRTAVYVAQSITGSKRQAAANSPS